MRKSRFTESQIVQILAEHDAGATMEELARRHGVHADIGNWRRGGLEYRKMVREPLPFSALTGAQV